MPSAPACISWRTSARMRSSSSGVAWRSSRPSTCSRMVAAPTNEATLGETPFFSSMARYSARVVQVMSYWMSPCWSFIRRFMSAVRGPIELPSPITSRVTPWRISLCERPSAMRESVDQESMFTKPGATARPAASSTVPARARRRSPTAAMRSPRIPTSARRPTAPVPSYTVPPRMIRS